MSKEMLGRTAKMKIKYNRNFYKNALIFVGVIIIFVISFAYFLGFDVNTKSLLYYAIFLVYTVLLFFLTFLVIDKTNKQYIIFDGEKIIKTHNNEEKVILYYCQILYTKYHNSVNIFFPNIDFGFARIAYKYDSKDKETKYMEIYLSKKEYKKIFGDD